MSSGTRDALLQAAERLMRSKGYAAFSYADLADTVGIRKASIHHHFATKEELGVAIVESYVERVASEFRRIETTSNNLLDRLAGFVQGFESGAEANLLPLCGALAAEMSALPERLQKLTRQFFDMQLRWLTKILDQAIGAGEIPAGSDTSQQAHLILSLMEGSSFIDWAMQERRRFDHHALAMIIKSA